MLRRSSSTSKIPTLKNDPHSKSTCRTSGKDYHGSTSTAKARSGSCDRLTVSAQKKPTSFLSTTFKKSVSSTPITHGSSNSIKRSIGTTPTLGVPGYKRSTSSHVTPNSRSRSPFKIGSERAVNDKRWVAQQFMKVCLYLKEHPDCLDHIPDILKPPTITTFVYVMNVLLKEIDPHVKIDTTNYKEIVLNTLKTLHYPGNVSNSLLKTVNTMHAWPQVISIFGWLVDLIRIIKRVEQPDSLSEEKTQYKKSECLTNYFMEKYVLYNNTESQEEADKNLEENFAKILNVNEEELKQLEEDVAKLSERKETLTKQVVHVNAKNTALENDIAHKKNEIDAFYSEREEKEEDLNWTRESLKERKNKLMMSLKIKRDNIERLREQIRIQPCTVEEKKKISKDIAEMKHTIDLKKERIKTLKSIKEDCDVEFMEAKKKIETKVYQLNTNLIKLAHFEPDLKILQLRETDFLSEEFENAAENLDANIKKFTHKFDNEARRLMSSLSKMKLESSTLEQQIKSGKDTIQALKESENAMKEIIEVCNKNMEKLCEKKEEQRKIFFDRVNKLQDKKVNVDVIRQRLLEITDIKNRKAEALEIHSMKCLEFFVKVREIVMSGLVGMNQIRTEIFNFLEDHLDNINEVQVATVEDLHKLDDLKGGPKLPK